MICKLFIKKHNIKKPIIICFSINSIIAEIIAKDSDLYDVLIIERSEFPSSKLEIGKKNKRQIQKAKRYFMENESDHLYIFKDNDLINQTLIRCATQKDIKITLIEEGLGLYNSPSKPTVKKHSLLKRFLFSYPKQTYKDIGMSPNINEILASSPGFLPEEKKKNKRINVLSFNDLNIRDLNELYRYFNVSDIDFNFPNDNGLYTILYMGQPFSEFNYISIERENAKIEGLFEALTKFKNLQVIIKPHPSEDIKKYKRLLRNNRVHLIEDYYLPAELIPAKVNIDLVLTVHSSSCYYINQWYGINAISLYKVFFDVFPEESLKEKLEKMYNMDMLYNLSEIKKYIDLEYIN